MHLGFMPPISQNGCYHISDRGLWPYHFRHFDARPDNPSTALRYHGHRCFPGPRFVLDPRDMTDIPDHGFAAGTAVPSFQSACDASLRVGFASTFHAIT